MYSGHKADVIDLAWSKANFLLSASIDKTVRLWFVRCTRPPCRAFVADLTLCPSPLSSLTHNGSTGTFRAKNASACFSTAIS